ncbi:MAG TPA: hypothetical protein VHR45_20460 [Thermoanaerobaculia bacterium]|nr:hypothetical protein [Thermoanaerobaculia bacterium]
MQRALMVLFLALAPCLAVAAPPPLPVGPEIRVNAGEVGSYLNPQVAVFPDGGFVVVWTVGPSGPGRTVLHARLFDAAGNPRSGQFLLVRQPGSQAVEAVAADRDGTFLVAWDHISYTGRTSLFVQRFSREGSAADTPVRVCAGCGVCTTCGPTLQAYNGKLAVDPRGGFAVAWSAGVGDHYNTYARRFSHQGLPAGAELVVAQGTDGNDGSDALASAVGVGPDGTLFVGYEIFADGHSIELARFDAADQPVGDFDRLLPPDGAIGPSVNIAPDGSFVVAWANGRIDDAAFFLFDSAVSARRFAADGTPLESASFQVNRRGSFEAFPQTVALSGGAFITVFTDFRGRDGSGDGVFGRAFAADGTPLTGDFHVNLTTAGDQIATSVAAGANGQIVVVWQSSIGPALILARRLTAPPAF